MEIDILGNGPSLELWEDSGRTKIGCNAYQGADFCAVMDKNPLAMMHSKRVKQKAPLILGYAAWELTRNLNLQGRVDVHGVVQKKGNKKVRNAGQVAILWALRTGFSPLHLWGFDSLWTGRRDSSSNEEFGCKKENAPPRWRHGWDVIFEEFPSARLIVHLPKGESIKTPGFAKEYHDV